MLYDVVYGSLQSWDSVLLTLNCIALLLHCYCIVIALLLHCYCIVTWHIWQYMGHFAAEQPWLRRGPDLLVGCGNLRSAEQILISATCTCRWLPSIHWQEILPTLRQNPAESAPRTVSLCASWHEFGVTKASSLSLCLKLLLWNDKDTWRLFQLCDNAITRICAQSGFWPRILCPGFVPLGLILTAVSSRRGPCPLVIPASSHVRRLRDAVRSVGAHLASAHSVAAAKEWDPDSS